MGKCRTSTIIPFIVSIQINGLLSNLLGSPTGTRMDALAQYSQFRRIWLTFSKPPNTQFT